MVDETVPPVFIPGILELVAAALPPNDVACWLRLCCRTAASILSSSKYKTIHLSQPVDPGVFAAYWLRERSTHGLTCAQRKQLVALVTGTGVMDNITVALQASGLAPSDSGAATAAAAAGDLPTLQALVRHGCRANYQVLAQAAAAGRRDICEWLVHNSCGTGLDVVTAAAAGGHVALLDWLLQLPAPHKQPEDRDELLDGAAFGCDLPTLTRIHEELFISAVTNLAAGGRYNRYLSCAICSPTPDWLAKVDWLLSFNVLRRNNRPTILREPYPGSSCLPIVPRCGSRSPSVIGAPELLRRAMFLMQERALELQGDAVILAAAQGNIEALQHLLGMQRVGKREVQEVGDEPMRVQQLNRQRLVWNAAWAAASGGHVAVLQLLREQGLCLAPEGDVGSQGEGVYDAGVVQARLDRVASMAAGGGHFAVLDWLLALVEGSRFGQQGQPAHVLLTSSLFEAGARSGRPEVVRWMHGHGCPWDNSTLAGAARGCSVETVEWMAANGYDFGGMVRRQQHDPATPASMP